MTKKEGQEIEIAGVIKITIINIMARQVRIGIDAPKTVKVRSGGLCSNRLEGEADQQYCNYLSFSILEKIGVYSPEPEIIDLVEKRVTELLNEVRQLSSSRNNENTANQPMENMR